MSDLILGIESSCDDTAAALVDVHGRVHASVIASQTDIHAAHGGVYPELASRAHVQSIVRTVDRALMDAGVRGPELRAIGVTRGPGLIGSLLVGINAAQGLAAGWGVPVIGVNHLRGHLRSADLEEARVRYPALVLLVSGGHTLLARMTSARDIAVLGRTRDDSVGEAYDKVGRMLGLGYPGGPAVDRLAATGEASIAFPRPLLNDGLSFSFSGLKSAVSRAVAQTPSPAPADVAASFVAACLDVLMTKCRRALDAEAYVSLVIVGGVAASRQLRERAGELCAQTGVELCLPPLRWSTDNAAMIALATWDYLALDAPPKPVAQTRLAIADY
ncbi:MAG: tRNA (adenosine(37)-N6)-threonylcarbamoyltransferase complex transferase subunit TsaD [Hyphomonadaceae bacterium]|nr:tRNA (adenosine(37)-N6)-threonylcarbamoyltransferase complex transferase subunit TsaD [Hyphomonadaceae bacterium]